MAINDEGTPDEGPTTKNGQTVSHPEEASEDLEKKIIAQIEYYFGDFNLPRDKFMLEQIKLDDGWIPMSTMLKFQRLAKLTTDTKVIVEALKNSNLIEVSEEHKSEPCIRRSPEFPLPELNEERRLALQQKTVYVKGYPLDSTLDDVMATLKEFSVDNIIMRRYKDRVTKNYKFKGSIFAVFPTKETAEQFVNLESFKVNDVETVRKFQLDYSNDKKKVALQDKLSRSTAKRDRKKKADVSVFKKGSVFSLSGDLSKVTREIIKESLNELDIVPAYIEFNSGDAEAYIRLEEENSAEAAVDKLKDGLKIGEATLQAKGLLGEDEQKYLEKAAVMRTAKFKKCKASHTGGRKNRGKGRNKRKSDFDEREDDAPKAKAQKADN